MTKQYFAKQSLIKRVNNLVGFSCLSMHPLIDLLLYSHRLST